MPNDRYFRAGLILLIAVMILNYSAKAGPRKGWQKKDVDLRMAGGLRITSVSYPDKTDEPDETSEPDDTDEPKETEESEN